MAELKFALLFSAVDQLSNKLGTIGDVMSEFTERVSTGGERIHEAGERMFEWGERVGIATAVLSEAADKLHKWSEAMSEPALAMGQTTATMAAMSGLGADKLAEVKEQAIPSASTQPGVTAEGWAAIFTRMPRVFQGTTQAMIAAGVASMRSRFGVDNDAARKLTTSSWSKPCTDTQTSGYHLFAAIKNFCLNPRETQQFAQGIGRLGGAAAVTRARRAELVALVGEVQQQMAAGRGSMIFASMVNPLVTANQPVKVATDFSHGLTGGLEKLNLQLSGTHLERIGELKEMGVSNPEGMYGVNVAGAMALAVAAYEIRGHWGASAALFERQWKRAKTIFNSVSSRLEASAPPIGKYLPTGLIGPIGIAAVAIYKHWDRIKKISTDAVDWMRTAGANLVKAVGEGILSAVERRIKVTGSLAEKIGGYFKFHSPPAYRPLREPVLNFRFGEALAERMKFAPVIAASTMLAAGIAGSVTQAAAAGSGVVVNIDYAPTINGAGSPEDWARAARQHADLLVRVIEDKLNRRNRRSFE
jgi:hypothetical protein